jgi:stage III sporulation protein AB
MKYQGFNFSQSWKMTLDSEFIDIFGDSEKIIRKFGAELGSTDIESQIALCDLTSERLLPCIKSILKEINDKRKVFLTVGACTGAALSVLLL